MAERKGFLTLLIQGFILLSIITTLGIAIAILVTTLNVQKQQKNPIVVHDNYTLVIHDNYTLVIYDNSTQGPPSNFNPLQDALSVPEPQQIQPGSTQYKSYQSVVSILKQGLNSSINPCNDFYDYTCGTYNNVISFEVSDNANYIAMANQMMNQDYVNSAPFPVKQTASYFNACKYARANWNTLVANGSMVANAIAAIKAGDPMGTPSTINISFPMYDGVIPTTFLNPIALGYLLAQPEGLFGVTTAVTSYVDTNWVDPQGPQGYALFIDQPTTMLPYTYYVKTWNTERGALIQDVIDTMNCYAFSQTGKQNTLDQAKLNASATALVDFDYMLAMNFSTDDTTRRQFARSYNPMTISQLQAAYPAINWHEYIPMIMVQNDDSQSLLGQRNYNYIVMEPAKLKMWNDALVLGNPWGITPEVLQNYVYYAVVSSQSSFLPWAAFSLPAQARMLERQSQISMERASRRRGIQYPKRRIERKQVDDVDQASIDCAGETMEMIQYANARIFIDNIYPTQASRDSIRANVAKVASSILIGFRSMIDQLSWMSPYAKKGAYNKIDNLVKNIAYPDWITDDNQLTAYYQSLAVPLNSNDYLSMVTACNTFTLNKMWDNLLAGSANRIDFNGPPGTTNAWYQPELNSITFPAAILHQPFYDPNWPASVNFGAMGLTHGFDDQGVQWDGVGNLAGWMDSASQANFSSMAQCVINEYSNFCPLDKATYGAGACVDGAQTQGENIADNGGIHAAFRAYKNYINLNGPDPLLPDGILQGFTADQLFFLGFAQVWCQRPPSAGAMERQILVDVHSPSLYRVFGTIQNFPAFKDAFNCPANSAYAPDNHCNVWVSDISSNMGLPPKDPNSLNIPQAKAAVVGQPQYSNYQSVIQLFKQGMNSSADPCNDFYDYTCGAWNSPDMSFDTSDNQNFALIAQQMTNATYVMSAPTPVKQVVAYFNICVNATMNWDAMIAKDNGTQAANAVAQLMGGDPTDGGIRSSTTNTTWPMYYQLASPYYTSLVDNITMGFLLGYPAGLYGVNTLISAYVDTNWVDPQGTRGYAYFIDQPTTMLPNTYYVKAWGTYQQHLIDTVVSTMNAYANTQGKTLDQVRLQKDAIDLVHFDYTLAMNFSTDDTTRRNYLRSYNPITIDDLQKKFDFVFWHEFIPLTMFQSHDGRMATLYNSSYPFILMEPDQLTKLNQAIKDPNNPYGITPDIVINYIYYNQLSSQSQYLPNTLKVTNPAAHEAIQEAQREMPLPGKRRRRRNAQTVPSKRKWEHLQQDSLNDAQINCAAETMEMLQYANARVFIDKIYPTQMDRDNIRNNVAKVASSILIGFRSMIDQLNWMTSFTKKGAYNKIENLVKNIAYPDWITDDNAFTMYHQELNISDTDDYFTVYNKASIFNMYQMFQNLAVNGSANRIDFNGPPGTTNAWYQPELNSITFPAAILHQPFYDFNWPASVNFGAMGVIAGHELTHGFDDEGVQWDGVGNLAGWMDSASQANFSSMAQCVINEYSNFCPLDKATYGAGACVDGAQTQGENIADNGGIHAAFRAYKNYINLNGPDPLLPDGILQGFTADQLFFLGFAQVWCQRPPSAGAMERQILVDVHSPSLYRVFGTIQNFPAFKDAFNCPANSAYAPDNHCNVWVSDISSNMGLPPKDPNSLNIPQAKAAVVGQPQYSNYQSVIQLFKQGMNSSADPCNDFYDYTCGTYNNMISFGVSDNANYIAMANQLMNQAYVNSAPFPVKQTASYFNACKYARANWNTLVANGSMVANAIAAIKAGDPMGTPSTINISFPMYDGVIPTTFLNPIALGYLLAQPEGLFGVTTAVTSYVDTNWVDPQGPQGYALFIDQPTTMLPYTYYVKTWNTERGALIQDVIDTMNCYAFSQTGKQNTLDQAKLNASATALVDFDYMLAMNFSTDDTTRRQFARSYNPMTISQLQAAYPAINWHEYIPMIMVQNDDSQSLLGQRNYNYIVMEPAKLKMWNDALVLGNPWGITPEVLQNYVYYAVVSSQSSFLPWAAFSLPAQARMLERQSQISMERASRRRGIQYPKRRIERKQVDDVDQASIDCAGETMEMIQYANARIFIDNIYPTQASRDSIRANVAKVASSILIGFRSMIDQLSWMSPYAKKGAYNKIDNLVKNIAYPDWITDDNQLTTYYQSLAVPLNSNDYLSMVTACNTFTLNKMWDNLLAGSANRIDFNGPPGTTNAWYQPELNSITFPAAILHQPFYDPNWPASVNFGAMGVIAGHELTHGFDDQGVQWDGVGNLAGWMDSASQANFSSMAQCVINEYSNFCPLDKATYGAGACVDGAQTQGENIADNGGIHAAFRAYKNYINLNGPDPLLPDGILQGFTADQLFFLGFAQVWCQRPPSAGAMERQILVDVHSPSLYRVFGTIQNFPAFKDAFNCPANSAYAPDNHCNVWVSDIASSYGQPPNSQSNQKDINIQSQPQAKQTNQNQYTAYQQSVAYFQDSVNFTADPCNDFWHYACGKYQKKVSFHLADDANLVLMVNQLTDPNYAQTIQNNSALIKEKQFFDCCVATTSNSALDNQTKITLNFMQTKVNALQALLGQNFTAVYGTNASLPNPTQMAQGLGYLSFTQAIDTYITPMVDTYWTDNLKGYQFFVDQNTAHMAKTYYQPGAWKITEPDYITSTVGVFMQYCQEEGISCTNDSLTAIVTKLVEFEQRIAFEYSTDDTSRRQYQRSWNLMTVDDMNGNYTFVDWPTYVKQVPAVAMGVVSTAGYKIAVMETNMTKKLSDDLQNSSCFDPNVVVNYLYMRLLIENAQYLPSYQSAIQLMPKVENDDFTLGLKKRKIPRRRFISGDSVSATQSDCMSLTNDLMQFANGRVFIDYLYPTADSRVAIRKAAGGVITNIINSFQGMLMQLDWMTEDDKQRALQKANNQSLVQNIAFPDWITTDQLNVYYDPLKFDNTTDNYYTMWDKLIVFTLYLQYNQLNAAKTDRHDFLGQPGTVNAWYQPELNSITFPAGILRPPYFNSDWPASVNYGGLGVVAGHELTHGFDDEGVQWGPTGNLAAWMLNDTSKTGFTNMAQCVIDEYSGFCPLNAAQYSPNCVNGQQTQGENIADNGGIHSAFRAYRVHTQLNGPDPMLPDQMFGQFTHDQLFFLSFGQVWCEGYRGDAGMYKQLMVDPHSPSEYRVFGTIQNYPAFQTAFNCPVNSAYAPSSHCNVWVPNVEA